MSGFQIGAALMILGAVVVFACLFLAWRQAGRMTKRCRRLENALELALGKITGGEISESDRRWAERTQQRLWEHRREE